MGLYVKVLLQFPSVFWPEDAALIGQIDENSAGASAAGSNQRVYFPTLINYHYAKGYPVLESQLVGDQAARALATMTDEEIAHALFLQLQNTFGSDIPSPVGHFLTRYVELSQTTRPCHLMDILEQVGPQQVVQRCVQLPHSRQHQRRPRDPAPKRGQARVLRRRSHDLQVSRHSPGCLCHGCVPASASFHLTCCCLTLVPVVDPPGCQAAEEILGVAQL